MLKFNVKGWRRQGFDPRDRFLIHNNGAVNSNPTFVDLSAGMGPYLNQGGAGTCGPHTAAEMIAYDQAAQKLSVAGASRLYTYWWTRSLMGTLGQDSGVDNRTMFKALNQYGFIPEAMMPYSDTGLNLKPSAFDVSQGKLLLITDYAAVIQNTDQMIATLANAPGDPSRPFCFGFTCYSSIESDKAAETGIIDDPGPQDTPVGGHDMTLVGINVSGKDMPGVRPGNRFPNGTVKLRQHWVNGDGSPWGDGGYGYVSIKFATDPNQAGDFWVINTLPGSVPPPPPPGPGPSVLMSLTFDHDVPPNSDINFRNKVKIPAGKWNWVRGGAKDVHEPFVD